MYVKVYCFIYNMGTGSINVYGITSIFNFLKLMVMSLIVTSLQAITKDIFPGRFFVNIKNKEGVRKYQSIWLNLKKNSNIYKIKTILTYLILIKCDHYLQDNQFWQKAKRSNFNQNLNDFILSTAIWNCENDNSIDFSQNNIFETERVDCLCKF